MEIIKKHWAPFVIINIYLVGLIGFLIPSINQVWAYLTSFSLLVSLVLLIVKHQDRTRQFYFSMVIVAILGMIVEIVGVQTGVLFGTYSYGSKLSPKLMGVPWMIGINWALLVYMTHYIGRKISDNTFVVASLGGLMMVFLDIFLEPFAIYFGLWEWAAVHPPIQNYLMWWITAFIMHLIFKPYNPKMENSVSNTILITMFIFFLLIDVIVIWF